jgi:hypothetical protein
MHFLSCWEADMNEPEHGMQSTSNLTPEGLTHPADVPAADRNRIATQRALSGMRRMPTAPCFSYSADVPGDLRRMPAGPCFSYSADTPGGLRQMPVGSCFSYSADAPVRGLRRMPVGPCFSYSADAPVRGLRRMPISPCFRY